MAKWGNEVKRAIEGWNNKDGQHVGGVDTGDKALDNRIREALKNGNVEHIQINVRGPELPTKAPHKLGPL
jgi:hypothetical protein